VINGRNDDNQGPPPFRFSVPADLFPRPGIKYSGGDNVKRQAIIILITLGRVPGLTKYMAGGIKSIKLKSIGKGWRGVMNNLNDLSDDSLTKTCVSSFLRPAAVY